ncbi:MAG: peptidoglycan-binding protein [Candidatus Omnitrophica bacterium]|nr:peptidoglycan-binding protein [Candidatus Omnitrophota bacterium]
MRGQKNFKEVYMLLRLVAGIVMIGLLAGCATAQKPTSVNQLQIRMAQVENRLDESDQNISEMKYAVEELVTDVARLSNSMGSPGLSPRKISVSSTKGTISDSQEILRVPVTPQEVQTALKNAGYYQGSIDGKLGSGSQAAIKAFQKDHDLQSDGIVGKKTWMQLKSYLE